MFFFLNIFFNNFQSSIVLTSKAAFLGINIVLVVPLNNIEFLPKKFFAVPK